MVATARRGIDVRVLRKRPQRLCHRGAASPQCRKAREGRRYARVDSGRRGDVRGEDVDTVLLNISRVDLVILQQSGL